jgi:hypothetical protein
MNIEQAKKINSNKTLTGFIYLAILIFLTIGYYSYNFIYFIILLITLVIGTIKVINNYRQKKDLFNGIDLKDFKLVYEPKDQNDANKQKLIYRILFIFVFILILFILGFIFFMKNMYSYYL